MKSLAKALHTIDIFNGNALENHWWSLSLEEQTIYIQRAKWAIDNGIV